MSEPLVHLSTGIYVCGKPRSWCRAPFVIVDNRVTNGTEDYDKATCAACILAFDEVAAQYAAKLEAPAP